MRQRNFDFFGTDGAAGEENVPQQKHLNHEEIVRFMSECIAIVARRAGSMDSQAEADASADDLTNKNKEHSDE